MEKIQTDVDSECKLVSSLEWWQNDGDFFLKKICSNEFLSKASRFWARRKNVKMDAKIFLIFFCTADLPNVTDICFICQMKAYFL